MGASWVMPHHFWIRVYCFVVDFFDYKDKRLSCATSNWGCGYEWQGKPQNRSCDRTRCHGAVLWAAGAREPNSGSYYFLIVMFHHYHDSALLCMCAPLCLCFQGAKCFHISSWIPERGNLIDPVHLLTPGCDIGHLNESGLRIPDCLKNKPTNKQKQLSSASLTVAAGKITLGVTSSYDDRMHSLLHASWENSP